MANDPSERRVRYAVVGAGNITQTAMLPAFEHARQNSELVAIVSGDPVKRRALCEQWGVEHAGDYDDLEAILEGSGAEAVYVAVPNTLHCAFTLRAAEAGMHVLCEKPMAMTSDDCAAMVRACAANDVKLMVAYRLHFEEANLRAIEIAQGGELGELRYFTSFFSQDVRPGDIRTRGDVGGGALFDMGVYCVNAARYLFREEPIEVFATSVVGRDPRFSGVDEATTALLRFPGDRIAQITVCQAAAHVSEYRIVGTEGDLRLEPAYGYATELVHHLTIGGETRVERFEKRDQFGPELLHFSRAVLEDEEPEPDGEEGLADVRVLEAVEESARTKRPVTLPAFQRRARPSMRQATRMPGIRKPRTVHAPSPSK